MCYSDGYNTPIGLVRDEGKVYNLGDGKGGAPHRVVVKRGPHFCFLLVKMYMDLLLLKIIRT